MSDAMTVNLSRPIASVGILDGHPVSSGGEQAVLQVGPKETPAREWEAQKVMFSQAYQALNHVVAKLNEFYDKVFAEHREEIAKLSIQIAKKILMQKAENGDYEIESIVKEALKNVPTRHDVIVHLNPSDLVQCQKAQEQNAHLIGVQFVPDSNIGRAECLLESPKGIIKSLIDENLERIGKALTRAE
jgi:flagellar biosynthesis/type III secretory pathway protein FliH